MSPELERLLTRWGEVSGIQNGVSVLFVAIRESVRLVQELLPLMGDLIHYQDESGVNALHLACSYGYHDVAVLLSSHLDQHIVDKMYARPLHHACVNTPSLVPIFKWTDQPGFVFGMSIISGRIEILWEQVDGKSPRDILRLYHPHSSVHVLAKIRRLLGTLPAAYIRLVHSFT